MSIESSPSSVAPLAGKKVLVTGAGGFIGSHLVERLVEVGAKVRAFVHYRADGSRGWLEESCHRGDIEFVGGDVRDIDSVAGVVHDREIVFHLAALIGIPYSYQAPRSYIETNIEGTVNVLQAARAAGVERVVHTSTSEVYGTAQYVPIDERHPLQAQSPYSASKIGGDKMAESFHHSFDLPVVTLRPFNTFGPRQSARAVIPTIVTQCLTAGRVKIGSKHTTRDFNFVADTVEGFVRAAIVREAVGQTINVGSGSEISIDDLSQTIVSLIGRDVPIELDTERVRPEASEVDRLLADNALAGEILGWKSQVSLKEGLARTIEWIGENLDRYRPGEYTV